MVQFLPIDDPDDPRIAAYRAVRDRDVAGRHDGFIAEGEVVLRVLARSREFRPESLLIAEGRVSGLEPILEALAPDLPVLVAARPVMDAVVGFPIHRGILAFGRRPTPRTAADLLAEAPPRAVVLALFGVSNHDNIGGIFRNAAAFGAAAVLLDGACCDPLYRKAIRVSVGGGLVVPFARLATGEDVIALLETYGFTPLALSPEGGARLADLVPPARAAVLLGAEGPGLPASLRTRAGAVGIPMAGGFDSLNVATTSGIVLHHLASGRRGETV